MNARFHHALLIITFAGLAFFVRLGGPKLWDRDEPRNAGCAAEMLASDNWVVPMFNGELRTHKPILLYWQTMLAYACLGKSEFSARFSSAFWSIGTCLITWMIGRRLFSPKVGLCAGMILATSLMFVVAARAATPDASLIFFMTAALGVFVLAVFPGNTDEPRDQDKHSDRGELSTSYPFPNCWFAALLFGLIGMAVLAKGPVGFVLPLATIGMFLLVVTRNPHSPVTSSPQASKLTRRNLLFRKLVRALAVFHPWHFLKTTWQMRPVLATIVILAVAGPWYLWVGIRTDGEWLRGFFFEHNIGRATRSMEGHNGSALWFYPATILVGFFPWSAFAIPTILDVHKQWLDAKHRREIIFLLCWIGVIVGMFSIAKTKLPSYVTPTYPALALLTATFFVRWTEGASPISHKWLKASYGSCTLVGLAILIAIPIATSYVLPGEAMLAGVGVIPLIAGIVGWRWSTRAPDRIRSLHFGMSLAIILAVFAWASVRVSRYQTYHDLLAQFPPKNKNLVATVDCLEPSWVFYSERELPELTWKTTSEDSEAESGEPKPARNKWSPRRILSADEFLDRHPQAYLITTESAYRDSGSKTERFRIVAKTQYFLKNDQLLLLQHVTLTDDSADHIR